MINNHLRINSLAVKLLISLVALSLSIAVYAQREVRTPECLANVAEHLGEDYIQVADIDLSEWREWTPIGSGRDPFTGTYDGNGHVVTGLNINMPEARDAVGLFGAVFGPNAEIKNLGVKDFTVVGNNSVGGLAGFFGQGRISQCFAFGEVTGNEIVGGLVGYFARAEDAQITESYASGYVNSQRDAGGLVGHVGMPGMIMTSYSTARVTGNPELVGGLVGREGERPEVGSSYWDTQASGTEESHGGSGRTTDQMLQQATYDRNWNFREVWSIEDGESYPFHLWQREPGEHNYPLEGAPSNLVAHPWTDQVRLNWEEPGQGDWIGYNIYRDDNHLARVAADVTEYLDEDVENYVDYNYYVTAVWEDESESRPTNTVTVTPFEGFPEGEGTEEAPYHIATARNLYDIRYMLSAHYTQTDDIDLDVEPWNEDEGWRPIGEWESTRDYTAFRGSFDGNGQHIEGLTINNPEGSNLGLFTVVENADISNLIIVNVDILGDEYIGTITSRIVGDEGSTISNCIVTGEVEGNGSRTAGLVADLSGAVVVVDSRFTGNVSGTGRIGGLFAEASNSVTIINCHFDGIVTGSSGFIAGIIANSRAHIKDCSVTGEITHTESSNRVGGIVGSNGGIVERCFVSAAIYTPGSTSVGGIAGENIREGEIHYCYADVDVTGRFNVGGIVGSNGGSLIQPAPEVVVTNCYATGSVNAFDEDANNRIGGFAGYSFGIIEHSYSNTAVSGPEDQIAGFVANVRAGPNQETVNSYWDTQTSGVDHSAEGYGRLSREMTYEYGHDTYVDWDFDEIWQHDPNYTTNQGYPVLFWQEVAPVLDSPVVTISIITEDDVEYAFVSWDAIAEANSYQVYATDYPDTDDWGDPIDVTGETEYSEAVDEEGLMRFYRVVASEEMP